MQPSREEIKQSFDGRFPLALYDRLQSSEVAIAGLGGLGSHIAVMLTRAGIGKLSLIDFDRVDISNLNRQAYDCRHLGEKKVIALAKRLGEINPYITILSYDVKVTEEAIVDLFYDQRLVCEAFDDPEAKAMLLDGIMEKCPNTVLVCGNGMAGYGDANCIQTKQYGERLYICGDGESAITEGMGLMAPRVALCASHQANKIVQLILEEKDDK